MRGYFARKDSEHGSAAARHDPHADVEPAWRDPLAHDASEDAAPAPPCRRLLAAAIALGAAATLWLALC